MSGCWRTLAPRGWVESHRIGVYSVRLDHRVRACRMMAYGTYEWRGLGHLLRRLQSGGVVFDVGANVGYLSAHFAEAVGSRGEVHFFEPAGQCREFLEHLLASDGAGVLQANWCAVGESSGRGRFFETEHTLSHGFARLDRRPSERFTAVTESEVEVVSLDDYVAGKGIEGVDLIKIDVEGHELSVLRGFREGFERGMRPMLFVEATRGEAHDEGLRTVSHLLRRYGYRSYLPGVDLLPVDWEELPVGFHDNLLWMVGNA